MRLRSRLAAPLAATILALGVAAVGLTLPQPAFASEGYVETATTTYTVNPAAGRVDVAVDIAFRNTTRATATTIYFYSSLYVWVEHAATHIKAATDAGAAAVSRVKRGDGFDEYRVSYGPAIYYGETRKVHVAYQLPGGAPRSSSDIRVGRAIASFCVVAQGDDGGATEVIIPSGYDITITGGAGGDLKTTPGGATGTANATWSTGTIDQPWQFWACLTGTNEAGYSTASLTSPSGREIDLEAWPEDPAWKGEVTSELGGILTKLEALVGQGLPGRGPITIREVGTGELGAYAGFFNPETQVIVMGEELGQGDVIAHELSHAWFNDRKFFDRWMSEGLAEWARVSVFPDACPEPSAYPGLDGPINLATWRFAGPRATSIDLAIVDWEYEAACYLVTSVAGKAGPDHWRATLETMFDNKLAYESGASALTRPSIQVAWRQWLDAVDEVGLVPAGQTDLDYVQNLLARFGIATDARGLKDRSAARARYHELVSSLDGWTVPEAILRPMSEWGFGIANSAMAQAESIRASVAKADAALPGIDAAHGPVQALFQDAKSVDDLKAAAARAADQATVAEAVARAAARVAAPRDILVQIGLMGADVDGPLAAATIAATAADLPGAQAGVATISSILDGASQQGLIRVAITVGVVVLVLLLLAFLLRRRRRGDVPALVPAEAATAPPVEVPPASRDVPPASPDVPPASPD